MFSATYATVARRIILHGQPLFPTYMNESQVTMTPLLIHCVKLSVFGPLLVGTNHFILRTPHRTGCCEKALTQSFIHHNVALVKVTEVPTLSIFLLPSRQPDELTVLLLPNISQALPWWQDNHCYLLHVSVVIMLWLIGVYVTISGIYGVHPWLKYWWVDLKSLWQVDMCFGVLMLYEGWCTVVLYRLAFVSLINCFIFFLLLTQTHTLEHTFAHTASSLLWSLLQ